MYTVTLKSQGPTPKLLARALNHCHRDAARNMGEFWHQRMRPKHFTNAGATEYGYTPRQGEAGRPGPRGFKQSYTGRKLTKFDHTRPLEYSGESKRRTETLDVRATSTKGQAKARVILHAPALNFRYAGSPIDMREEMTKVSQREAEAIAEETATYLKYRYRLAGEQRTQPSI